MKGIYLIPNGSNFKLDEGKPVIGSSTHIGIGIEQLKNHFDISVLALGIKKIDKSKPINSPSFKPGGVNNHPLIGVIRDLKALILNNKSIFSTYNKIKKLNVEFIYERSEYLNFQGIIIAKILGIPHYYEANWVHYSGIKLFYSSYLNKLSKKLEELMYSFSNHVFFVGNQHLLLNLKKDNWSTIQNGVSQDVVESFSNHVNITSSAEIRICVLASLMKHHRLDILLESLNKLSKTNQVKVFFIGKHFDDYLPLIPEEINYEYLGAISKDKLYSLLSTMNIAVISGGPFYSSFMKLYDYAAVKLAVICPDLSNLRSIFTDKEILFFENENSHDLMQKIQFLLNNQELISKYGENIYKKVKERFTWEEIFNQIAKRIKASTKLNLKQIHEDSIIN